MDRGQTVLVCGDDEQRVAETASGLEAVEHGFDVRAATGETALGSVGGVDCVVSLQFDLPSLVTDLRAERADLPVIVFASGGTEQVNEALADDALTYVQPGTETQYVVLAHRIESVAAVGPGPVEGFDRYSEVIGALDDGVYALDDEGQFIFANEALAELTGYRTASSAGPPASSVTSRSANAARSCSRPCRRPPGA